MGRTSQRASPPSRWSTACRKGAWGTRRAPLRTADLIGLDNLVDSLNVLYERRGDESCRPCECLLDKVRDGDPGRGFYD